MPKPIDPHSQHIACTLLYSYFNGKLFEAKLAPPLLNFDRHLKAFGFFAPDRWQAGKSTFHEISLNPNYLDRDFEATCATLVHEMAHAWQAQHGQPGRGAYHNAEWGTKMKAVGLHPSDTGAPGGRETGDRVSHYIIDGGPFSRAFRQVPARYRLPLSPIAADGEKAPKPKASKVKYTCPSCEANAWGKPGLNIACGDCDETFEPGEVTG